jgi:hypothetical protein
LGDYFAGLLPFEAIPAPTDRQESRDFEERPPAKNDKEYPAATSLSKAMKLVA